MDIDKNKLFNIKNIIDILKEKKNTEEYYLFQAQIPNLIDKDFTIDIKDGPSNPKVTNTNYFLTYAILHELLQIYNSTDNDTLVYLSQNILERKEISIENLLDIFIKKNKLKKDEFITFDYGHKGFFFNKEKFNKGSYIKNITFCYNNNNIFLKLLNIFLIKDIKKNNKFFIKLPSIVSIAVIDILKLLSYIFKKTIVIKALDDSFFKDSFHVFCDDVDVEKYNEIKKYIMKDFKNKNFDFKKHMYLSSILNNQSNNISLNFDIVIKNFSLLIEILIFVFVSNLKNLILESTRNAYRDEKHWEDLNYYNNFYI